MIFFLTLWLLLRFFVLVFWKRYVFRHLVIIDFIVVVVVVALCNLAVVVFLLLVASVIIVVTDCCCRFWAAAPSEDLSNRLISFFSLRKTMFEDRISIGIPVRLSPYFSAAKAVSGLHG